MLTGLGAPAGALVVMDAGIATDANVTWLVEHGYRYLVVRRGGLRQFDENRSVTIETAGEELLHLQKELSPDGRELCLYCHSPTRQLKEEAMLAQSCGRFEAGLQQMSDGLHKPRSEKNHDQLLERLGRLKQKSRGASQHYQVHLVTEDTGKTVTAITWQKVPVPGTMATHPGVYCLRTNELAWDEERLWRTYTMLTDLESVFRSLKSELGLRPIYHHKEVRSDGHLFITVLAYQCVQFLRVKLKNAGITDSWATLRDILSLQRRVTATFSQRDGLAARAQSHRCRTRSAGDLSCAGDQLRTRRYQKTDQLNRKLRACSATRDFFGAQLIDSAIDVSWHVKHGLGPRLRLAPILWKSRERLRKLPSPACGRAGAMGNCRACSVPSERFRRCRTADDHSACGNCGRRSYSSIFANNTWR
jgi:hypothetical protein